MYKIKSEKIFTGLIYVVLALLTLIMLYPLYFTVIASISEPYDVVSGNVILWPKGFTLDSYIQVFRNSEIWAGYRNSIVNTIVGTTLNLVLTIPAAYALSKKDLWGRGLFTTFFVITMYFSGGLLPTYLLVRDLDLLNKPYTLIMLGGFSVYNMVVARTYFQSSIPESLYEAAEIDGCSRFGQFFRIAMPLAKPFIAVIALYDDLAVLDRASDTAFLFDETAEFLQVGLAADKTAHECHNLAGTLLRVAPHAQVLLLRRKSFGFGLFVCLVFVVGVGRIDHAEPRFPVVCLHICSFRRK